MTTASQNLSEATMDIRSKLHDRMGYTLLEVLVVVVVMFILVGGGIASYRRFSERQQLVKAAEDLVTRIRGIQKEVDSGTFPPGCLGILKRYNLTSEADGTQITVRAYCESTEENTTIDLPGIFVENGVTLYSDMSMELLPLGGGITNGGSFQLQNATGSCMTITYTTGGSISSSGPDPCP